MITLQASCHRLEECFFLCGKYSPAWPEMAKHGEKRSRLYRWLLPPARLALLVRSLRTSYTSTANQLQTSRPSVYYSVRLDP